MSRASTAPQVRPRYLGAALAPDRILSIEQCRALDERVRGMTTGGGETVTAIDSRWTAYLRWARNVISLGGDTQHSIVNVTRNIFGAIAMARTNALDDESLQKAVRRAEAMTVIKDQLPAMYPTSYEPQSLWDVHPIARPNIWFDATYDLDATQRANTVAPLMAMAEQRGLLSAGFLQVGAQGKSIVASHANMLRYYPRTTAQFSVTVRDVKRSASGWAGVDENDWARIDCTKLMQIAIDKCERSRDPVAIEPGRFVTILEPQAVADLWSPAFKLAGIMARSVAEDFHMGPFANRDGTIKMGEQIMDARMSLVADPTHPGTAVIPFDWMGEPYLAVEWIKNGVITTMSYERWFGLLSLQLDLAIPDSLAFRFVWDGPTSTVDEMIASTERGILVTRLNNVEYVDPGSAQMMGTTRDGTWLIEKGKISKAIKNFRFLESPLAIFNNILQVGTPQRTFRPDAPAVCPPVKVRDFYFSGLSDAV